MPPIFSADARRQLSPYPVAANLPDDAGLTDHLLAPLWRSSRVWLALFALTGLGTLALFCLFGWVFYAGIGLFGTNIPAAWAFPIVNFVWWIGIGHAGTLISAILLLLEQRWRTSINRFAEAMTLFAVVNAALMPVLHLGRPWFAYWLLPYPATTGIWPNFKSALTWDVMAVSTYGLVSLIFWYMGLLPDLASARDRATTETRRKAYAVAALGFRGSGRAYQHYRKSYILLAGLATPLVVSVHSIVSLDFAIMNLPGYHSTIFPPYFVAGAIFSGFGMVLSLLIPCRRIFGLEHVITMRHLDNMAKVTLATAGVVIYSYLIEQFGAWYSGDPFEFFMFWKHRPLGQHASAFWVMIACNCVVPQLLWFKRFRTSEVALFLISILVNVGMWLERFIIVVTSLTADYLPSSWYPFHPSWVDVSILTCTVLFFLFLFLLFLKFVPAIPISEIKEMRARVLVRRAAGEEGTETELRP